MRLLGSLVCCIALASCTPAVGGEAPAPRDASAGVDPSPTQGEHGVALLAGGCFWCVESAYDDLPGVVEAVSGYAGGPEIAPTYQEVAGKKTGHLEVVRVVFERDKLTYEQVLEVFWHNIDPTQRGGQFCDRGPQYRSAVFPLDEAQRRTAEATRTAASKELGKPVVTEVLDPAVFWRAEEYHQDFHKKQPVHYARYRSGCGRDRRLKELWGDDKPGH